MSPKKKIEVSVLVFLFLFAAAAIRYPQLKHEVGRFSREERQQLIGETVGGRGNGLGPLLRVRFADGDHQGVVLEHRGECFGR